MPCSDKHVRQMIESAVAEREGDRELKVWVVDPDPCGEVRPRYAALFCDRAASLEPVRSYFQTAVCKDTFADIFKEIA